MSHLTILESENKCLKGQLFGLKDDYRTLSVAFAAREKRIAKLESQVTHWKSNHDEQLRVKRQLLDRPDLQDRANSIWRFYKRIAELEGKTDFPDWHQWLKENSPPKRTKLIYNHPIQIPPQESEHPQKREG